LWASWEERSFHAEVGAESQGEDEGVGWDIAAAVVAHQEHGLVGRYAIESADVGPEVQRREQPGARQMIADVVGIAVV